MHQSELVSLLSHLDAHKGALAHKVRQLCPRARGTCVEDAIDADAAMLGDCKAFDQGVVHKICELFPAACVTCAGFAADDIIMGAPLDGDGTPVFSADRVSACLWECLHCDDPHEPSDCGRCISWNPVQ